MHYLIMNEFNYEIVKCVYINDLCKAILITLVITPQQSL